MLSLLVLEKTLFAIKAIFTSFRKTLFAINAIFTSKDSTDSENGLFFKLCPEVFIQVL